jgi:DsbC/DsbD-like thiol-disulfide interchange protein
VQKTATPLLGLALLLPMLIHWAAPAIAEGGVGLASAWSPAPQSRARLVAGVVKPADGRGSVLAGVEIALSPKWKTYWRMPGDSGVPPQFDWSGSQNLAEARVLYPVPQLFKDKSGSTIGYVSSVVFPVEIRPIEPSLPIKLAVTMEYGACLDICIPVEARLTLDIPLATAPAASPQLAKALAQVPRTADQRRDADPLLQAVRTETDGLIVTVSAPEADGPVGLFVEAPDGLYIGPPDGKRPAGNVAEFRIPLPASDLSALKGKSVTLTSVNGVGATETTWIVK